jgi:DNA primase
MTIKRLWLDYTKLRSALDFGAVLSHYQIDHPAGRRQVKVACPFHDDRTPSLSINLEEGKWQCFGCHEHGNTLEFVCRMEGHDPTTKDGLYAGALTALSIMGQAPEAFTATQGTRQATGSPPQRTKAAKRPESQPAAEPPKAEPPVASGEPPASRHNPVLELELTLDPAHPFLAARGLPPEVAREFGLGYCDRGLMKGRIAIPIRDEQGQLVAFAGRFAADPVPDGTERYKLPRHFHKSLVLFNLDRAQALGKKHLVLVEGFWSVFRLHRAGIPVASPLGSTVSPEQAALLPAAGFRYVTLLFDGDDAGRQGAAEALSLIGQHVYVRALSLPDGEKPDTMPETWFDRLR